MRLPSAAAAACRVSDAAQAASAAAAGSVPASARICAAASAGAAGGVVPDRVPLGRRERVAGRGAGAGPAAAELGPAQVRGELPAAEPHRPAVPAGVAGQRDRVPGDLARVPGAEPLADQHPGRLQAGEELLIAAGAGRRGGDLAAQRDARRLVQAAAGGLLGLGAGRAAGRGAVPGRGGLQPVAFLGGQARLPDAQLLEVQPPAAAVLAGQHRHDVDVVIAVPDRDPPHALVFLAVTGQAGAVHHVAGDLRPLIVAERLVTRRGAHHRMPHRPAASPLAQGGVRLVQQPEQPPEIPCPVRAQRRLQLGRVPPPRDDMRIGVLLVPAGAVQVVDQAFAPLAALVRAVRDLPDHRGAASRGHVPATGPRPGPRSADPADRPPDAGRPPVCRGPPPAGPGPVPAQRTTVPGAADHPRRTGCHPDVTGPSCGSVPRRHPAVPRGAGTPARPGPARRDAARSRSASRPPG